MRRRKFDPTERLGVNAVSNIVTKDLRWIWREQHVADFGIDGQIEVVDGNQNLTGRLLAAQVKSGSSYFRGSTDTIPFYVDKAHLQYWDQHSLQLF
jgi:hypothetical protein